MKQLLLPLLLGSTLLAAGPALAQGSHVRQNDLRYMKKDAQGLRSEVQLGRMAQTHAKDPRVKQFGQRMIDDHGKDLHTLEQIAHRKGVRLPARPDTMQQRTAARLSKLSGSAFDRAYITHEVNDHKLDVADESKELHSTHDQALKQFAAVSLPEVRAHLRRAKQLQNKI